VNPPVPPSDPTINTAKLAQNGLSLDLGQCNLQVGQEPPVNQ
jgi:hypothetical protein